MSPAPPPPLNRFETIKRTGGGNAVPTKRMSQSQEYCVAVLRDNAPPIYLTGPLRHDEAQAWVKTALTGAVVLPWPENRLAEELDMAKPAHRPPVREDLLDLPRHLIGEIIDGELITHPTPAPRHSFAAGRLLHILIPPFEKGIGGPGGWLFLLEPYLSLGSQTIVPDIAAWRLERLTEFPEPAFVEIVPDWVCEFISPSSVTKDMKRYPPIYARYGVEYRWLGDPRRGKQTLETFVLENGEWDRTGKFQGDGEVAAPPFAEVPFRLGELWPSLTFGKRQP